MNSDSSDGLSNIPSSSIDAIIQSIPFYKAVRKQSEQQYQELLRYSAIRQFKSGEVVLQRGSKDNWSYFLVKGQLVVTLPDQMGRHMHINYVTPGEVFGDLSVLLGAPRTADVHVDENCREATVFGTDFSLFGQLGNMNIISLETKLIYYRHTVQSLRWKLEIYRSKYPTNPLADKHRSVKVYSGERDGLEELETLHKQSLVFAKLLLKWNQMFGMLSLAEGAVPKPNIPL